MAIDYHNEKKRAVHAYFTFILYTLTNASIKLCKHNETGNNKKASFLCDCNVYWQRKLIIW